MIISKIYTRVINQYESHEKTWVELAAGEQAQTEVKIQEASFKESCFHHVYSL